MFTPIAIGSTFNVIISANTVDFSLPNAITALGWDGVSSVEVKVTVNPGVILSSDNTSIPAFTSLPTGSRVYLYISSGAYIVGRGGKGGVNQNSVTKNGGVGGTALLSNCVIYVTNYGVIGGGGGGGGASGTTGCDTSCSSCGGCGCGGFGAGGGGAGYGAAGYSGTFWNTNGGYTNFAWGYAGALTTGGSVYNYSGAGGALGASGGNGHFGGNLCGDYTGGLGGSPGPAVVSSGNVVWVVRGTVLGTES